METWASPYLAAQAAYLRNLGTAAVADVVEHDGIGAVRTGVLSNTENGYEALGFKAYEQPADRWFYLPL